MGKNGVSLGGRGRPGRVERSASLAPAPPGSDDPGGRILGAAARLFRDKGYSATSLREIAREARIKSGSLYYYFPSKEVILNEVLDRGISALTASVRHAIALVPPGSPVRARIEAAVRAHLHALFDRGDESTAYVRMYVHLPVAIKDRKRPVRQEYLAIWKALLREAQARNEIRPEIDVEFLCPFILGALTRAVEWYDVDWGSVDALIQAMIDTLFAGLEPHADGLPARMVDEIRPSRGLDIAPPF
ncbi:MAG: TetR/AcrR family transcriptional regulator [Alphaproteobacteria bacterium]